MTLERFAGRYELIDTLGHGGGGSVWRAWDHRRGRYVAAKVLRHGDAGALLRFVREQSLRVEHPHVVAPSGWAADDDRVLLTMDLVRGGSVHNLLSDYGTLPPEFAMWLIDQLLDALVAVHAHGIVHRDVKPANLLLEPTGRNVPFLRLSDFGIAVVRNEPRLTSRSVLLGTPGYVPPEVIAGAEPDPRQDLYLVGVVGREILTGRARPAGADRPEGVPLDVWGVLGELLAADPDRRPGTAAEVRDQLRAAAAEGRVGALDPAHPDAIEVFDHVGALPAGYGPTGPLDPAATPQPAPEPPPRPAPVPAQPTRSLPAPTAVGTGSVTAGEPPHRRAGLLVGSGLAVVAGIALVVAVLAGAFGGGGGGQGPSSSVTDGSAVRIGQSCQPPAGVRGRTADGTQVVCTQGSDGTFTWQPP